MGGGGIRNPFPPKHLPLRFIISLDDIYMKINKQQYEQIREEYTHFNSFSSICWYSSTTFLEF